MLRNGPTGNSMDRFEYRYAPNNNKLLSVKDDAGATPWTTQDLEDQDPADTFDPLVSSTWNYQYDAVGNAVKNELDDHVITYTAAGLVKEVRTQGGLLLTTYTYNGSGARICKTDHDVLGVLVLRTWYAYDASGGLAATYEQPAGNTMAKQAEVPIGGSSRIGMFYRPVSNTSVYELTDHLGNVRATFKRDASLEEWTDHDAWGTPMEGRREVSTLRYRYGYQGQECEQVGTVSSIFFELRTWDTRIGRWTAPDPYGQYFSPYMGMGNNPVSMTDPDGGWAGGPGGIRTVMNDWLGNSVKMVRKANLAVGTASKALSGGAAAARALSAGGVAASSAGSYVVQKVWEVLPLKNVASSLASNAPKGYWHPTKTETWGLIQQGLGLSDLANATLSKVAAFDSGIKLRYAQVSGGKVVSAAELTTSFTANAGKIASVAKTFGKVLGFTGVATSAYELQGTLMDPKATFGDTAWALANFGLNTAAFVGRATPAGAALGLGLAVLDFSGWKP